MFVVSFFILFRPLKHKQSSSSSYYSIHRRTSYRLPAYLLLITIKPFVYIIKYVNSQNCTKHHFIQLTTFDLSVYLLHTHENVFIINNQLMHRYLLRPVATTLSAPFLAPPHLSNSSHSILVPVNCNASSEIYFVLNFTRVKRPPCIRQAHIVATFVPSFHVVYPLHRIADGLFIDVYAWIE